MSALKVNPTPLVEAIEPAETFEEICASLNSELVDDFKQMKLPESVLEEFVFACDHLDELSKIPNFPTNRLLNTPDVVTSGPAAACVFNDFAKRSHDPSMFGCAVSEEVTTALVEFFEVGYLSSIWAIVKDQPQQSKTFTLDGVPYTIRVIRYSPHPEFGILRYDNKSTNNSILIPFHLSRVLDA